MKKEVIDILKKKSLLKQDVYSKTLESYKEFKEFIELELLKLRDEIPDERVRLKFAQNGSFETHAYVGSDVLVFNMHSNVFAFPDQHAIWKNSYIEEDRQQGYFGVINIYNFLAESFLQTRMNDAGYLIGRIFINKDGHFLMDGKGEFSYYYKNIRNNIFNEETMESIFDMAVKHVAEFDLNTPPYNKINVVKVKHIKSVSNAQELRTGKRLGFKFKAELEENN